MKGPRHAMESLDADLASVREDHLLVLALNDLADLLRQPDADPFTPRRGPDRSGLDDLALTLSAATDLPDNLTVQLLLPEGTPSTIPTAQAQASLQRHARDAASAAWRDAMAVRSMGRRQLPIGVPLAIFSAFIAYGAGYLASVADSTTASGFLIIIAGVAITVAWVVSWMVVESAFLDWRQPARQARAYDLLAHATLRIATESPAP
jgi:hypothetical protein